jgi:hypothetical protein
VANKAVELAEEERDEAEDQLEVQRQAALQDKMQLLQRQNKLLQATSQVIYIQDFVRRWSCMIFTAGLWEACLGTTWTQSSAPRRVSTAICNIIT